MIQIHWQTTSQTKKKKKIIRVTKLTTNTPRKQVEQPFSVSDNAKVLPTKKKKVITTIKSPPSQGIQENFLWNGNLTFLLDMSPKMLLIAPGRWLIHSMAPSHKPRFPQLRRPATLPNPLYYRYNRSNRQQDTTSAPGRSTERNQKKCAPKTRSRPTDLQITQSD